MTEKDMERSYILGWLAGSATMAAVLSILNPDAISREWAVIAIIAWAIFRLCYGWQKARMKDKGKRRRE